MHERTEFSLPPCPEATLENATIAIEIHFIMRETSYLRSDTMNSVDRRAMPLDRYSDQNEMRPLVLRNMVKYRHCSPRAQVAMYLRIL